MANYDSFIFAGHGTSERTGGYDPGATSGNVRESDLARSIQNSAKKYLSTTNLNIHYDENNFADEDLAVNSYSKKAGIVIHINAGGGNGSEIFVPSVEKYLGPDFNIVSGIAKLLNIPNRGVKSRDYNTGAISTRVNGKALNYTDYYKEIRDAWGRGISLAILEVGFIDTSDLTKIQNNIDGIGLLVAKYIAEICAVEIKLQTNINTNINSSASVSMSGTHFRAICGSFKEKQNAQNRLEDLKKAGFDAFIEVFNKE